MDMDRRRGRKDEFEAREEEKRRPAVQHFRYRVRDEPLMADFVERNGDARGVDTLQPVYSVLERTVPSESYGSERCLFVHGRGGDAEKHRSKTNEFTYWGEPTMEDETNMFVHTDCKEIWFVVYPHTNMVGGLTNVLMHEMVALLVAKFDYVDEETTPIFAHSYGNLMMAAASLYNAHRDPAKGDGCDACLYGAAEKWFLDGREHTGERKGKCACAGPKFFNVMGPLIGSPGPDTYAKICSAGKLKRYLRFGVLRNIALKASGFCSERRSVLVRCSPEGGCAELRDSSKRCDACGPTAETFARIGEDELTFANWAYVSLSTYSKLSTTKDLVHTAYLDIAGALCGRKSETQSVMDLTRRLVTKMGGFDKENDGALNFSSCSGEGADISKPWTDSIAPSMSKDEARWYSAHLQHGRGTGRNGSVGKHCATEGGKMCPHLWYRLMTQ